MRPMRILALVVLALSCCGTQADAAAPFTCIDANGKKSFQDHPCGTKPAFSGNPKFSGPRVLETPTQRSGKICWTDPCRRGFQHGSAKYFECRSTEAQRLKDQCLYLRKEDASATGERQDSLKAATAACCSAYEQYEIER